MSTRPVRMVLFVAAVLGAVVLATGPTSGAQDQPDLAAPALTDYGPTSRAPSGGELGPRASGSRWRYRGTLGRLGNNEQVVPPVIDPVADDPARAPLTGRRAGRLDRRAVVVKIDNVEPARPPVNINAADIVYEELVESGFTRLAAVYHSQRPSVIGPVRSARSTDIGIAVSFNRPIFAFSGANSIFEDLIADARLVDRGAESHGQLYSRSRSRFAPHNLFTNASRLLASASDGSGPKPHFAYRSGSDTIAGDVPTAHTIRLRYLARAGVPIRFEWDADDKVWRRWQNGSAHRDSAGVQIAPQNVVVQIVEYADAGLTDKFGEDLYEAQMVGTGEALIFTNGHVIEATWTRPTLRSVTTFTDDEGNHILLTKGRTWVALVPPGGVSFDAARCKGRIATVAGTGGDDVLRGTDGPDVMAGLAGDDVLDARGGDDLVCGGGGNDRLVGGPGDDRLFGGSDADDLRGGVGDDRLNGGGGPDQLHGDHGVDRLRGKGGTDQLHGIPEVDDIGSGGSDVIVRGF